MAATTHLQQDESLSRPRAYLAAHHGHNVRAVSELVQDLHLLLHDIILLLALDRAFLQRKWCLRGHTPNRPIQSLLRPAGAHCSPRSRPRISSENPPSSGSCTIRLLAYRSARLSPVPCRTCSICTRNFLMFFTLYRTPLLIIGAVRR